MRLFSWLFRRRAAELPAPRPGAGPVILLPGSEPDAQPIRGRADALASYAGWVYAAVSLIAQDVRAAEYVLWRRVGSRRVDWQAVEDHPVLRLLSRPSPTHTWGDMVELTQLHLDLTGEAYWHVVTDGSRVVGIQVVAPHWVHGPVIEGGRLTGWRVQVPGWGEVRTLPAQDVIWLRYPHPLDPWRGASPVEAFAVAHHFDLYLRAYGASLLRNDAGVPTGIISTDQEITQEDADLIAERWRDRYYRRRDGIAVLGRGARYQPIAIPISDLRFLELGRFNRDQILAIYRVPASKLGLVDDVNRANAEANDRTYRANSLLPRLRRLEEAINTYLLPRILGREASSLYLEFTNPVGDDPEMRLQWMSTGLRLGAVTVNEYREAAGLDPLPGGDRVLVPISATPTELRAPERRAVRRDEETLLELAALRFLSRQDPLERAAKSEIRRILSRELREVLRALREHVGMRGLEAETREWWGTALGISEEDWRRTLQSIWIRGMEEGWGLAGAEFGGLALPWQVYETLAAEYAARHAALQVRGIQETTAEAIRGLVTQAVQEGWSVDRLAQALAELYDGFKGARAETIARTETAQAVSRGKWAHATEVSRRYGVRIRRRWSAVNDQRTRPTHAAAHGQTVGLNEPYIVGGAYLAHPADPAGPAREVINCRCTEVYLVEED